MTNLSDDLLGYLESIKEFKWLSDFLEDTEVDIALAKVVKCINKPEVPSEQLRSIIVQLQGISFHAQVKSKMYKTVWKTEENARQKYELYHSIYSGLNEFVQALKYQAK